MEKVLVYALSENIGGVEEYVLNLSRYNKDKKCDYEYIVLGDKTPYQSEMDRLSVKYYFVPKNRNFFRNIQGIFKLFYERRNECNILYFNTSALCYPIPYLLAKKYGYKIVLHSHLAGGTGVRKIIHMFNRVWINKICSVKLACSTPAAKWMFGKLAGTAQIVPNAINLEKFQFQEAVRKIYREKLNISEGTILLGNVGRLSQVKNQKFLLKIVKECRTRRNDIKLLLVGDGEKAEELKYLAKQYQITENVIFYGKTNTPEKLMCAMDCIVMPSIVEGFPVTLIEAQASGLPCLVSTAITEEVNISGNIQFVSLKKNVKVWTDHILQMELCRYDCIDLLRKRGYEVHELAEAVYRILQRKNVF